MKRTGFFIMLVAMMTQGCVTVPREPSADAGPIATIIDTSSGGGQRGGVVYYVEAINGVKVDNNMRQSLMASYGHGLDLQLKPYRRTVSAGKNTLKLVGRQIYAMPIQGLFSSKKEYFVEGEITVDLAASTRYEVVGRVDAYRLEVWLQNADTNARIGPVLSRTLEQAEPSDPSKEAQFTCCNLRYEGDWISDGNWTDAPFIPAGARIELKEYGRNRALVTIDGRAMRIGLDYGREQQTKEAFVQKLIVSENPKEKIKTYSEQIQKAIHAGKVVVGMTQEQVLISIGYPRMDVTSTLESSEWTYWVNEGQGEYTIVWDENRHLKEVAAVVRVRKKVLMTAP